MQKISSRQEKQNQHGSASYVRLRLGTVKICPISREKDTQSANTILELPRNPRQCTYWNVLKSRSEHPPFCGHTSARAVVWELMSLTLSQRSWSCMGELVQPQLHAVHILGYLGLQPWYSLRGGITILLQNLCKSARYQPVNQKSQNQLCPVISNNCQRRKHHSLPWEPASPGGQIRD